MAVALMAGTAVFLLLRERSVVWAQAHKGTAEVAVALRASLSALLAQSVASIHGIADDISSAEGSYDSVAIEAVLKQAMRFDPLSAYLALRRDGATRAIGADGRRAEPEVEAALSAAISPSSTSRVQLLSLIQLPGSVEWYLPVVLNTAGGARSRTQVVALVPVAALLSGTKGLHNAGKGTVSLLRDDGQRLVRYHVDSKDVQIGGPQVAPASLALMSARGTGSFQARSNMDGVEGVWGFSRADTLPLFVVAGVPIESLNRLWLQQSIGPALLLAVAGVLLGMFAYRLRSALLQQSRHIAQQEHDAAHDALTGLMNRRSFESTLRTSLQKHPSEQCVVLLLDLNSFKDINDTLGHEAGDAVLCEVAARLVQHNVASASHCVARVGGDEFVMFIRAPTQQREPETFAGDIRACLASPVNVAGINMEVVPSFGLAVYPDDATSPTELLRRAGVALVEAKQLPELAARYSPELDSYTPENLALRADFARALRAGAFTLAFQPKVRLVGQRIVGCEALARWIDPERGNVPPARFVPIAENTELIHPLTDLVLRQALAQVKDWMSADLAVPIAVNISANSLLDQHFVVRVEQLLDEMGVPARLLELEVTESAVMRQPDVMVKRLQALRDLGVVLAIDDFGTGYASLAYLKQLPVHKLKIDQVFIRNLSSDAGDRRIVLSSIQLAQGFGMTVVAEGVECKEAADVLKEFGCEEAQGYFFDKPMFSAPMTQRLRDSGARFSAMTS